MSDGIPPPTGKTGNEWTSDDFASSTQSLITVGAPEFISFCVSQGSCALQGPVLEKFVEIINQHPVNEDALDDDEDPQAHFAVLVKEGLIEAGLLPQGDPDRYQYKVEMGFIHYGG